ncbi:MAG TPA: M14 family metallopeptidase, partial [Thermoanaerobaculia bacterium]|nr:M14 family metallopeptidase [Thermoanaerobaculia bacterium]
AQMLLRDLVSTHRKLRDDLIVLVAPIYNADGNEHISPEHRTNQLGPLNGVGVRENAQGLDLNRDYMKLESPEARGLIANVLNRWDPLLTVDLHTTNGSYHGYQLTYSPTLNPNADDDIIDFERGTLLPHIRAAMKERRGKETYHYGNFVEQLQPEKGWYTFDQRPRFGNNYVGLRNRFTILSEAYSYIDFRARVEVTYEFLHEILAAVEKYGSKMMRIAAKADERIADGKLRKQGVRFEIAKWKDVEILWEKSAPAEEDKGAPDPWTEQGSIVRTGEIVPMKMTDYGVFAATEKEEVPYAYVIDAGETHAAEVLRTHGITVEKLDAETTLKVEQFAIKEDSLAEQEFQKHHERTLTGKWKTREETFPAGTFVVRMNQPLARLAFYLLEPRSDDGLINWNVLATPPAKIEKTVPIQATVMP